jgi:D-alanine-D-alanine ligase
MKKRIAVVRGGPGFERDVSMRSGKDARAALAPQFDIIDVVVDSQGNWIVEGAPIRHEAFLTRVDGVFNTIPGSYGEDGTIQKILDTYRVPYLGSNGSGSHLSLHKDAAKRTYADAGLKTPVWKKFSLPKEGRREYVERLVSELFATFPLPAIVKPVRGGLSVGTNVYTDRNSILAALSEAFKVSPDIIIEEYIDGKEVTCSVVSGLRDQALYTAPVVEIIRPERSVYDYYMKHHTPAQMIYPANISQAERQIIAEWARKAHAALGLNHISRSDFIVHPRRGVYILETNSVPSYMKNGAFLAPFDAVGASHDEVFSHLGKLATGRE